MSVEITKHWLTRCLPAPRSLAKEEYPSMITIWSFFLFFWLLPLGVATAGCLPPSPPIPSVTQTHFMSSFTTSMDIFFGLLFFLLPRSFIFNNLCQYIHYPYTYLYQTISALPLTFSPNISTLAVPLISISYFPATSSSASWLSVTTTISKHHHIIAGVSIIT